MMKIDRAELRRRASIALTHEDADTSYKDAYDHGKTEDDRKSIAWIKEQLDDGNPWAWCDVTITASLHGLHGQSSLSQCSYESRHAFKSCPYYDELVGEALEDLAMAFEKLVDDHALWEHDRVTCIPCASILE